MSIRQHRPAPDWFWVWLALAWFLGVLFLFGGLFWHLMKAGLM